ncbi:MAG: TIGR02266 family protein [Myxococcota bacterium]
MARRAIKPDERRDCERVPIEVEVTLNSENNFYTGFTEDISAGGVFVASHETLPVGTVVTFTLKLGKGVVTLIGTVRWVREPSPYLQGVPPGYGVSFDNLNENISAAIQSFIAERRESLFYDDDPI